MNGISLNHRFTKSDPKKNGTLLHALTVIITSRSTPMSEHSALPSTFVQQLRRKVRQLSTPLIYAALLMYYAFRRSDTPAWAKRIVMGALVYLLSPFDAIPDLAPVLGYTDDLGVLTYGLVMIAAYIDRDVRAAARQTLTAWTGTPDESALQRIDRLL